MSYTRQALYPCNPGTERGRSTKLSSANVKGSDKIIYANGRSVIHPALSTSFSGHVKETTVARFSPSGFYCASADVSGLVKIWDTVKEDQSVTGEYKVISGRINDLAWDADSERIIAAGNGMEKFGHAFMRSTGTSTGEIIGHSKAINAVSIRPKRPYRAVTAGDDGLINFHQGPPFKYVKTIREHTKFVQDVKFSPNGDYFLSVGSDFKVVLYNGENGDKITDFTDSPHKGSIMACSWGSGSDKFITSSMDNTVKLWDAGSQKHLTTWSFDKGVPNQQVGNVWVNQNEIVSLSLGGDLNVVDVREGNLKLTRVVQAPQKSVSSGCSAAPGPSATFFAGSADGRVFQYDTTSEAGATVVGGEGHTNLVSAMTASAGGKIYTAGFDDKLREVEVPSGFTPASFGLAGQPKSLAATADETIFVMQAEKTGKSKVQAVRNNQAIYTLQPAYKAISVAARGNLVVIGGEDDNKIHVYNWDGQSSKLAETAVSESINTRGQITTIAVSANGEYVAAGDSVGKIVLFNAKGEKLTDRWTHHAGRIASLSFNPSSTHVASTSLDTHVYVYNVASPSKYVHVRGAAPMGGSAVFWLEDGKGGQQGKGRVVSGGADACVRVWEITLP
ncbi:WD40-repeat-containing domain protein [Melanogaster broomeanus]|nr:WD40-repeat-containing domain protein [Melanogaster broomeanus]